MNTSTPAGTQDQGGRRRHHLYTKSYDIVEDARAAGRQAREKLTAKSVEPGKYDLVLSPEHLFLTIHESVGHADRTGSRAGLRGQLRRHQFRDAGQVEKQEIQVRFGHRQLRRRQDHARLAGRVGYDDEGVASPSAGTSSRTASWSTTRPRATRPTSSARRNRTAARMRTAGAACSSSACRTSRWRPGKEADAGRDGQGRQEGHLHPGPRFILDRPAALQLPVRRPAVLRNQERQDHQSAGRRGLPVQHAGVLERLHALCDERDWRMGGSFFDGKGQPSQVSAVSHGSPTTRFNGINVINTARKIG
jgi:TldD protein